MVLWNYDISDTRQLRDASAEKKKPNLELQLFTNDAMICTMVKVKLNLDGTSKVETVDMTATWCSTISELSIFYTETK